MDKMTMQRLEQYRDGLNEAKNLEKRIARERETTKGLVVDFVQTSQHSLPFAPTTTVISGVDIRAARRIRKKERRLEARRAALEKEEAEIEAFIDTLNISVIRQIIEFRYIDGLTWRQTALKVYGVPTEDRPRKRIERFFEEK